MTTDPEMSAPTSSDEVPVTDALEQQQTVSDVEDVEDVAASPPAVRDATVEADDGDLAEQAIVVPLDEEDEQR